MAQNPFPEFSEDLIKKLDRDFPPRCIRPGESLEDHQRYAGKRELVDKLKQMMALHLPEED